MTDTITKIDGKGLRWADKTGLVHVVEGSDVHRDVRLLWTLCERDVPANTAWKVEPGDHHEICITCAKFGRERGLIK